MKMISSWRDDIWVVVVFVFCIIIANDSMKFSMHFNYSFPLIYYFNFFHLIHSRKPFKLNGLLVVYNLAMAILNFHIFYQLLTASISLNYSLYCEPCRQVWTPDEMKVRCTAKNAFLMVSSLDPRAYNNYWTNVIENYERRKNCWFLMNFVLKKFTKKF